MRYAISDMRMIIGIDARFFGPRAKGLGRYTQKLIENLTSLYLPKIHAFVITQKDFKEMLLDSKANFGKEMFKSRLLFKNTFRYYELLKEAIENGFRG